MSILFVQGDTSGHSMILNRFKVAIKEAYPFFEQKTIVVEYFTRESIDPKIFVFENAIDNVKRYLKEDLSDVILIISDFFCVEGNILAKIKRIPHIVSIPATVDSDRWIWSGSTSEDFKISESYINEIEKVFMIRLPTPKPVSDGWLFDGDLNIIWNFFDNEKLDTGFLSRYVRCGSPFYNNKNLDENIIDDRNENKIYVSLGTIAPLLHKRDAVEVYQKIVTALCEMNMNAVISCPIFISENLYVANDNVVIKEWVDQQEELAKCRLFIHHGGGNGFNESVAQKKRSIIIPFFGDQFDTMKSAIKNDVGTGFYIRELTVDKLKTAINTELNKQFSFDFNINDYRDRALKCIDRSISFRSVFTKGDLLFGTTVDRLKFCSANNFDAKLGLRKGNRFVTVFEMGTYPMLVDHWNDLLRTYTVEELENEEKFKEIAQTALEYREYLVNNVKRIGLDVEIEDPINAHDIKLIKMCCLGMEFFLKRGCKIHFVLHKFSKIRNPGTSLELSFLMNMKKYRDRIVVWRYNRYEDRYRILPIDYVLNVDKDFICHDMSQYLKVSEMIMTKIKDFEKYLHEIGIDILIQSRIKDIDSIKDKIVNTIVKNSDIEDIVGFRIVHLFSECVSTIVSQFIKNDINKEMTYKKNDDIHYFYGKINGVSYEIQIMTMTTFIGLSFEHDRTYKPKKILKYIDSEELLKNQKELQNIIDKNNFIKKYRF